MKKMVLISFLVVALGFSTFAHAGNVYSISGSVKDASSNQGIPTATVTVRNGSSVAAAIISSDPSGNYTTTVETTGDYYASATKTGYDDFSPPSYPIEISDTNPNAVFDISLIPTGETPVTPVTLSLGPGWNFISFPKDPSPNNSVAAVLNEVSSNVRIVWGYDNTTKGWLKYKPGASDPTLTNMASGLGYWVYMDASGTITMTNWAAPPATITLSTAWNLVGYNGASNTTLSTALNSVSSNYSIIWNWTDGSWFAHMANSQSLPVPDLTVLKQKKAYWIRTNMAGGQTVIWQQPATPTIPSSFPVVVFTDVHFNPLSDASGTLFQALVAADVSQWAGIFQGSGITTPSAGGTDTNYPLLISALSSIKQNLGASPLIIFTGDILGHYLAEQYFSQKKIIIPTPEDIADMKAFANKTVTFFMQQVRSSVGNIPVMFALGNADSYWGLGPDNSFLSNTAELYYSYFVNGTVDHQTFLSTYTSGGYYSAEPTGMNLMVIGLNTFEFSPSFGSDTSGAVTAELKWFDSTLASAQNKGKKVWLLMHVPPGADKYSTAKAADASGHITKPTMMWNQDYQKSFLQIISKYPGLIAQTLTAHTHMDEYRIMSSGNVADTTPGITPYFGNYPAFKVFTFSSDTLKATDYTSLNYELGTTQAQFNNYYTFSTAYSMQGLLSDSLAQLYPQLPTNITLQNFYRGSYFSGNTYTTPVGNEFYQITNTTWPVYWCGIEHMEEQGLIDCVNFYSYVH